MIFGVDEMNLANGTMDGIYPCKTVEI